MTQWEDRTRTFRTYQQWEEHWPAEINALLDGRSYSVIPQGYWGWLTWAKLAAEII
jgi:hypothetical protein